MTQSAVRNRLLDAAESIVFADGVARTPVDRILALAGASPPSLYTHFGGKDGLIEAVLRRRLERWDHTWSACISAAADDRARLLAVFDALELFRTEGPAARWCAFLGSASELGSGSETATSALAADTALFRRRFGESARRAGAAADLVEDLLLVLSGTFAMMLRGNPDNALARGRAVAARLIDAALPPR